MVGLIDKLLAYKEEFPKGPTSEASVMAATACTRAQAQSTLHLAGYRLRGGLWLPLGIGGDYRTKKQGRSSDL
jgi:hypothetical protein